MERTPPALLPILRTRHTGELLALLFLHPDQEFSISEISRRLCAPVGTIHAEVRRLEQSGLFTSRQVGNARLLKANQDNRYAAPIAHLVILAFGPQAIIAEEFADIAGAGKVLIFGSWAARYHEEEIAPPPGDIDVLVIGDPRRRDVYAAALRAQERLDSTEVNPVIRSMDDWETADDPLIQEIKARPAVVVIGNGDFEREARG